MHQSSRQVEYDIAKGIAISAVVMGHNGGILPGSSFISPYFMALFFIIAGIFYKDNSVARAFKLGSVYCQYTLFLFCISLITQRKQWIHNLFGAFYGRYCFYPYYDKPNILLMTMENEQLWFLLALLWATLLFGIVLPRLDTVKKKVITVIILTIISWGFTYLPILLPWSLDTVSAFTIFMLVGYWMKQYSVFAMFYHCKYKYIIFVVLLMVYWSLHRKNIGILIAQREYGWTIGGGHNGLPNVIMYILIGIIGSFLCIVVCNVVKNIFIGKLFAVIGCHTIPILGLHEIFYRIVSDVVPIPKQSDYLKYWAIVYLINTVIITVCVVGDIFAQKFFTKMRIRINQK